MVIIWSKCPCVTGATELTSQMGWAASESWTHVHIWGIFKSSEGPAEVDHITPSGSPSVDSACHLMWDVQGNINAVGEKEILWRRASDENSINESRGIKRLIFVILKHYLRVAFAFVLSLENNMFINISNI